MTPAAPTPAGPGVSAEVERLREAIAERDDLLAMAAHELRNPLHALSLQLALARAGAETSGQAATAERLAKAQVMLARYVDRVTVLLELARLNVNAYPLDPQPIDLSALLRGLAESLAQEARFRDVRLEVDVPANCPAVIDALVIEQILDNLLLNAFKHAACSTVTLSLRLVAPDRAEIAVADDGRGIAPADQQRIFGKFATVQASRRGSGTGLGLWIVRKLLDVLGGSIALTSAPQAGSKFLLTVPLSQPVGPPR